MKRNGLKYLILFGAAVCALAGGLLWGSSRNGQTQNNQQDQTVKVLRRGTPSTDKPPTDKELDDAATPIVDLNDPTPVDSDRRRKNSSYDGHHFVMKEVGLRISEVVREPERSMPDIPAAYSDLIIEGRITDCAAFLSNDKGNIYSEFTVHVTGVLKDSSKSGAKPGDVIVTQRPGGRVRYPEGSVIRYTFVGQGSPIKGSKYLLFLWKTPDGSYKILTGYEIRGNQAFALDGVRINNGLGRWAFDKHNGEEYERFRKSVEEILKNDHKGGR